MPLIIKNPQDLEKFLEELRNTIHLRISERVFGQFQELCERIVDRAFVETIDKYTNSSKLVQENTMPFQDFVPEGSKHKGGEGSGFRDFIPADEPKKEPEQPKEPVEKEEKPEVEVTDQDLADMGIPEDKVDEFRKKGAEEKAEEEEEKKSSNKKKK